MNRKDLYNSFCEIDDDILERSETAVRSHTKSFFMRWGIAAASFGLIAACTLLGFPSASPGSNPGSDPGSDPNTPPMDISAAPNQVPDKPDQTSYGRTSDTYADLPELLTYLSAHDAHDGDEGKDGPFARGESGLRASGMHESGSLEKIEIVENTGVAIHASGEYAYHIGEAAVYISRLDGGDTESVGSIDVPADGIFICNDHLLIVSRRQSNGDVLDQEMSVDVKIYDITVPQRPMLLDEYTQLGDLTACWMSGANLYLITSDGVCACGWSRLEDSSKYYPSLSHNGETEEWADHDITILGEPTRVQYAAVTVINGNSREVVSKEALYGNILKLFFGADWIAATVAGETEAVRENPVIYTFDGEMKFTGKVDTAKCMNAPKTNVLKDYIPQNGVYLHVDSVTNQGGIYRVIGTYMVRNESGTASSFMAIAANTETKEESSRLLSAEMYPYGSITEILWEENRAVVSVGIIKNGFTADMRQETRFIFAEFHGLNIAFYENDLTADYLDGRVGVGYGNPLDKFKTLIPLGGGMYVRYSKPAEGPGGFDVFDFSDSLAPLRLYHAETSLSGEDAFDYVWYVYDENTFGTLKVVLGAETYFRNVGLSWCVYKVDTSGETVITLWKEYTLGQEVRTFLGADILGYTVFHVGYDVYYVTKEMTHAAWIG